MWSHKTKYVPHFNTYHTRLFTCLLHQLDFNFGEGSTVSILLAVESTMPDT